MTTSGQTTQQTGNVTRYTITGKLKLNGALHIGSGGSGTTDTGDSLTDASIIRDSSGTPYIPGSSLRGVLRTAISQYAPVLGLGLIREDHVIDDAVTAKREERSITANSSEGELQDVLEAVLEPAERLFGTVHWSSPLLIPDLHLLDHSTPGGEIRHGVGIDRDTGAARDKFKYDFEVLPRGLCFGLWIRCDVPHQPESYHQKWSHLLALVLHLLSQGELTLGGRLARGVGQVQLTDCNVYRLEMGNRKALLTSLLASNADDGRYGTLQKDWLSAMLKEIKDVCQTPE
jgi:CRISPR-associated RAMP protein (TIGR02581 family)